MAYRLKLARPARRQLRRVVRDQIDRALEAISNVKAPLEERIHVARTSCKRIRAALRLIKPASPEFWRKENAFFRDAARSLSPLREAAVLPATITGLLKSLCEPVEQRGFAELQRRAVRHSHRTLSDLKKNPRVFTEFAAQMRTASRRWKKTKLTCARSDIFDGFCETYRWARRAWRKLSPDSPAADSHECRKRGKAHAYHCRLLRCAWPEMMRERQDALTGLTDRLGEEHDLAVLDTWIVEHVAEPREIETAQRLRDLIVIQREELRRQSCVLGQRLFVDKPSTIKKRITQWWKTAENETEIAS